MSHEMIIQSITQENTKYKTIIFDLSKQVSNEMIDKIKTIPGVLRCHLC